MPEIKLQKFIEDCLAEVAKRFSVTLIQDKKREPKIDKVTPENYAAACQTMRRLAPDADPMIFEFALKDISPAHFIAMLGACLGKTDDIARCVHCIKNVRNLVSVFFVILEGLEPEQALRIMEDANPLDELAKELGSAVAECLTLSSPYRNWLELMFEPAYLTHAARAVEGLPPEQGKAILQTAFTVVNNSPKRPDADRFRDILRNTRDYIIACAEK